MKGTSFQKPLEFSLVVEGETWRQGDPISGTLTVKNHGQAEVPFEGISVKLAMGAFTGIRKRERDAFDVIAAKAMDKTGALKPGATESFSWRFETDRNFPITENSKSPFLVYGPGEALETQGQLQLKVVPYWVVEELLNILRIQLRFVPKAQRNSKGWVESKFSPPDSRGFAKVEALLVHTRFEGEELQVRYSFALKKLEATAASIDMKKGKKELEQAFSPAEYLLPSGRFNHEALEASVRGVIDPIASAVLA